MMMALRGQKKSFNISLEPFQQILEWFLGRLAGNLLVLRKDALGVRKIVLFSRALEDKIEAMNGSALWQEEFRDRLEAGGQGVRGKVLQN